MESPTIATILSSFEKKRVADYQNRYAKYEVGEYMWKLQLGGNLGEDYREGSENSSLPSGTRFRKGN